MLIGLCLIGNSVSRSVPIKDKSKQVDAVTLRKELKEIKWISDENAVLEAWDCSDPADLQNYSFDKSDNCRPDSVKKVENKTYIMLQDTKATNYNGYRCSMQITRRVYQCGGFVHAILVPELSYFSRLVNVTSADCEEFIKGRYRDLNGNTHPVKRIGQTYIRYNWIGRNYVEKSGHVQCEGHKGYTIDGVYVYDVLAYMEITITNEQEKFIWKEGLMKTGKSGLELPCDNLAYGCELGYHGTFIWFSAEDDCTLKETRRFRANELVGNNTRVVMASDKSMISLTKRGKVFRCGEEVFATSIRDVYIQEKPERRTWKKIHPREMSTTKYTNAKDQWIVSYTMNEMESVFQQMLYNECTRTIKSDVYRLTANLRDSETTVWPFDKENHPGVFAMSAGDSLRTFKCRERRVMPREADHCYWDMPVYIPAQTGLPQQMFLQPGSHRLLPTGISIECNHKMAPNFKTESGRWIQAAPEVTFVDTPQIFQHQLPNYTFAKNHHGLDFEGGGIYTFEDKERMEDYVLNGHNIKVMMNQMRDQVGHNLGHGPISPNDLFPVGKVDIQSWRDRVLGVFSPVIKFLDYFGKISAIFIALFFIYYYGSKMFICVMSIRAIHEIAGCSWKIIMACCSDQYLMSRERNRTVAEDRAKKPRSKSIRKFFDKHSREERWRARRENRMTLQVVKSKKPQHNIPPDQTSSTGNPAPKFLKKPFARRINARMAILKRAKRTKEPRYGKTEPFPSQFPIYEKNALYNNIINQQPQPQANDQRPTDIEMKERKGKTAKLPALPPPQVYDTPATPPQAVPRPEENDKPVPSTSTERPSETTVEETANIATVEDTTNIETEGSPTTEATDVAQVHVYPVEALQEQCQAFEGGKL